jgi:hypothetical protein
MNGMVVDATEHMVLTILAKDCKTAVKGDPNHCAFANAIARQFPGFARASTTRTRTYITVGGVELRWVNSKPMYAGVVTFDQSGYFPPGDYLLKAPSQSEALGCRPRDPNNNGSHAQNRGLRHKPRDLTRITIRRARARRS